MSEEFFSFQWQSVIFLCELRECFPGSGAVDINHSWAAAGRRGQRRTDDSARRLTEGIKVLELRCKEGVYTTVQTGEGDVRHGGVPVLLWGWGWRGQGDVILA